MHKIENRVLYNGKLKTFLLKSIRNKSVSVSLTLMEEVMLTDPVSHHKVFMYLLRSDDFIGM